MGWFLLALAGPLLYAITNYIDKLVLERYFSGSGVGSILIFSALFSAFALPFLFMADPTVFQASAVHIIVLALVGALNALVLFFYLKALAGEEVSIAIIFYQLVPVMAYGFGFLLLGEVLTGRQSLAMLIIILGTSIISIEIKADARFKMRRNTIFYMCGASFCWALAAVMFKAVALEENAVRSLFWEHLILMVIGLSLFVLCPTYRCQFLQTLRNNSVALISLNTVNESAYVSANIVMAFAYLRAPVSVVLLANSYQSLFALVIGFILTRLGHRTISEGVRPQHLAQKGLAIALTALGTYVLLVPER